MINKSLLLPSKQISPGLESTKKYQAIHASILDVGLIEPLSVSAADNQTGTRVILDGHVRLAILTRLGYESIPCLEARENESYTYNSRVNRMSTVQEHKMLRRAVERGVSAERLAKALHVNIEVLRRKVTLLDGICAEAADLVRDRQFSTSLTGVLRKMIPRRQVMCVELMLAANMLTVAYAKGLLYTTPATDLVDGKKPVVKRTMTAEQLSRMQHEATALQERYKAVEQDYGENMLHLTVVSAYLNRLLANSEVNRYLARRHPEMLAQLFVVIESTSMQG